MDANAPPSAISFDLGIQIEDAYQATIGNGARVVAVIGTDVDAGSMLCALELVERCTLSGKATMFVDASSASDTPSNHTRNRRDASTGTTSDRPLSKHLKWFELNGGSFDQLLSRDQENLREVWTDTLGAWDVIIIDCHPALSRRTKAIPGILIAQSADATLLVAPSGEITAAKFTAARTALEKANVVGIVMNNQHRWTVGEAAAAAAQRLLGRPFPRLARRIATMALQSRLLDVQA